MKILILGSFQYDIYSPAFAYGFTKLGHIVDYVDTREYRYKSNVAGKVLNIIQDHYYIGHKISSLNKDIVKKADEFHPDIVFLYTCYNVWPKTIKKLQKNSCFVMNYNNDDPFSKLLNNWGHRYFHAIIPLVDLNFVYRKKNISDFYNAGAKRVEVLLPYYRERANFYDASVSKSESVAFLGHFENDGRDECVKALIEAGVPITVYGGELWKNAPLFEDIKNVITEKKGGSDYNRKLNECSITLVFLSKLNSDTYTRRCFEIPAAKSLMLCEYTEDMNEMFPEDECAVYFRNKEELVQKCKILLAHPERVQQIADNGYNRLKVIGGSEVDRCRQIIEIYNKYKKVSNK